MTRSTQTPVARGMAPRRSRILAAVAAAAALVVPLRLGLVFAMQTGRSKKQMRGTMHNKNRLPTLYELPLEAPEAEPAPKEPQPERRLPYTINVVAQFPDDVNPNWKYVERKITHALENTENMIRHVDVRVQLLEHFHREKLGRPQKLVAPPAEEMLDETPILAMQADSAGSEALCPYQLKVKVELKNRRLVVISNPEKHAQPTLTEAVDHMADLLKKVMREEKEKDIRVWRKRHQMEKNDRLDTDLFSDEEIEADWQDSYDRVADEQMEALYRAVEADEDEEEADDMGEEVESDKAAEAAEVLGKAVEQAAPAAETASGKAGLQSFLLGGM